MKVIKQRPFAFSCALFLLTAVLLFFLPFSAIKILAALFVFTEGLLIAFFKKTKAFFALYLIPPLIMASAVSFFLNGVISNSSQYDQERCDIEFTVTDITDHGLYFVYDIKVTSIDGKKAYFNSTLSSDTPLDGELFSSYSANVKLSQYKNDTEGFSSYFSYFSKGVILRAATPKSITPINKTVKLFPEYYFKKINLFLSDCFENNLPEDANALCQAFVLGNRDKLSDKDIYNFRRLGLSHMLAVSGLHLSILCALLEKLLKKTKTNKNTVYVFMIFAVLVYGGITGFSPSVKRAAIMLVLYYASFLISKSHDSITSLLSSVALICFLSPYSLFDIGLWLSFTATYGIVAAASPVNKLIEIRTALTDNRIAKLLYKILSLLLFSVVPVMFSLPVVWLSYQELAVLSPVSNILFTPLLMGIMFVSPLLLICSPIAFLASIPSIALSLLCSAMLTMADILAGYSPIVSLNYSFSVYIITALVISYLVISLRPTKNSVIYFIPFLCAVCLFAALAGIHTINTYGDQKLIYSSGDSGDAFLALSENKGMWVDISGMSYDSSAKCKYYMKQNHLAKLHSYVVTDYHGWGIGSLTSLLSFTEISNIYLPKATTYDEKILEMLFTEFSEKTGINTVSYDLSDRGQISFFGIDIDIKRTVRSYSNSPSSLIVKFSNDNNSLSYIGKGADSSALGMKILTDVFKNEKNTILGSYGRDIYSEMTILDRRTDSVSYYASNEVISLWNSLFLTGHKHRKISSGYEFVLADN